ncbi:MAG: PEGA domain-containing protein [bacterium]
MEEFVIRRNFSVVGLAILCVFGGCLKTVAVIDSSPSGAEVYYDSHLLPDKTPMEFEVDWYGLHTVTLVHDGYPASKQVVDIKCPKHLWIPLDLIVTLLPFPITDRHEFHFNLDEVQAEGE